LTTKDNSQTEAEQLAMARELLAEGRDLLDRQCATTRYRHLFPSGSNLALLLRAYQELDRWRTVRHRAQPALRRDRRRLVRIIRRLVREDALGRDRRLLWRYPTPRPRPIDAKPPEVVRRALAEVDGDARADVDAVIHGRPRPEPSMIAPSASSSGSDNRADVRLQRGLAQFSEALINASLADPREILRLHPQYLQFTTAPQPLRRKHPIATMLFVKLPLQLLMLLLLLFNLAYLGAYHFFNDERLGEFLTDRVGGMFDGEIAFGSLHWSPMLIVDLITGQPHTIHGYDIEIWEPYRIDGLEKTKRTAYAEHVEVELVIHELIPWNRLGVPGLLEIPWVLHFEEIQNHGELWVNVRAYQNPHRDGEWMLSLVDAFDNFVDLDPPPHLKKLSYRIDHGQLDGLRLNLDLEERSGWATALEFEQVEVGVDFEGWAPAAYEGLPNNRPETLPLRYELSARGGQGSFVIANIHEGPIEIGELRELEMASGLNYRPIGDLWLRGDADLGGSPSVFEGRLIDVFGDLRFDFGLGTTDVGPIAEVLMPPKLDDQGRMRMMIDGRGSPASLKAIGPVDDVVLQAVGQGLTLDFFPEPAWKLDDVEVSVSLASDPLPEIWADQNIVDERWIVYLDTFRGAALDGSVRLHRRAGQDHVVLGGDEDPMLISIYLDLLGINLGQLTPSDPELAAMLQGSTSGGLQIHQVVIDDDGLDHVEAELQRVAITRDHGPADDNLPRDIRADGEVIWDDEDGLDLRGLRLSVDGGQLRVTGGFDKDFEQLEPTSASIRVDNGEAFLRAFGLPRWFDRLAADFSASGPLTSPHGSGSLDIAGAGSGALAVDDIENAKLAFTRGTLSLDSPRVEMLGGSGPLEADLVLLDGDGDPLEDPKLRVALRLDDINRDDILGSGIGAKDATIELALDDGSKDKRPVPLSQLQARGGAYADTLTLAGVDYRDAEASFAFTRDGIEIDRMLLSYHRPVSPALHQSTSVPIGRVEVMGTVGFDDDPSLALDVMISNLPVSALAESLESDLPVRGQIARGSRLRVTGSLRRPDITGQLVLAQLGAAGIPLGGGVLELASSDMPAQPGDVAQGRRATAAHRRVQINGTLAGAPSKSQPTGEGELEWGIDATVAFGGDADQSTIEAAINLRFASLPLDTLLAHPSREQWRTRLVGGLHELVVETRYCPSLADDGQPLLAACALVDPNDPRQLAGEALRVDLSLAHLWYRARRDGGGVVGGDPCHARDTTCSLNPLVARLDGSHLSLAEPWQIRSGGSNGPVLIADGTVDLTSDDEEIEVDPTSLTLEEPGVPGQGGEGQNAELIQIVDHDEPSEDSRHCEPGVPDNASLPPGTSAATLVGGLDFSALAPFLGDLGDSTPVGRLDIDFDITGVITTPTITGYVRLPENEPIELEIADTELDARGRPRTRPIPIEVSKLDLRMAGGTVYLEGAVGVYGEILRFGQIGGRSSFLDIAGPCTGRFALAAAGTIDGALVRRLLPDLVESSSGGIDLRQMHVAGDLARFGEDSTAPETTTSGVNSDQGTPFAFEPEPLFDALTATLSLSNKAIRMSVDQFGDVRLASGLIEVRQCTNANPCGDRGGPRRTRGIAVWIAGQRSALSSKKPSDALLMRVGDRGRADVWGELILTDRLDGLEQATITTSASTFPLTLTDNSGRVELEAALSSERITFVTDGLTGRITGEVIIDRSTWLRDARQGVAVLSFADPNPAPPSQLPEFIRDLDLDLHLRTAAPFRIDNNVAKQLEARADLRLGGTVGDPDLSGTIDVERGVVDIDILGGAYDVARGRVLVQHDLSQSIVDLWAVRQKQIKINNQLLTLNLHLSGSLDAIQWECTAPGDTSGALATTRGCVDYLIFDAGNTDLASSDVRDRNNNSLIGTRFLPLAGRLTQVEINDVIEREAPRLADKLPEMTIRLDQVGISMTALTRPDWLDWGWGRLELGVGYTRGYPGSLIRDSRSLSGRLEILENTALEAAFGQRNYSVRGNIIDPPVNNSIQIRQRIEIPSAR
jgi:hypothetical protein